MGVKGGRWVYGCKGLSTGHKGCPQGTRAGHRAKGLATGHKGKTPKSA